MLEKNSAIHSKTEGSSSVLRTTGVVGGKPSQWRGANAEIVTLCGLKGEMFFNLSSQEKRSRLIRGRGSGHRHQGTDGVDTICQKEVWCFPKLDIKVKLGQARLFSIAAAQC